MSEITLAGTTLTVEPPPVPTFVTGPPASTTVTVVPVAGPGGADSGAAGLIAHINSPMPHPAYDVDIPSLSLIFDNGLV